jgi:hypothetical protein
MASLTSAPDLTARGMTNKSEDGLKLSSSQDGSLENGQVGKPSYTIKEAQDNPKHISGHWKSILGHGALVLTSMIGIVVAMLVLVLPFNLDPFNVPNISLEHYYFLRSVPTSAVLCITSLASLLSVTLVPSLLKLSSFNHAHELLVNSAARNQGRLPSTMDLSLILRALSGSPHAFIQGCRRSFTKPTSGQRFIRKVTGLYATALLLRLVIVISYFLVQQANCHYQYHYHRQQLRYLRPDPWAPDAFRPHSNDFRSHADIF